MTKRSLAETKEWIWLAGTLVLTGGIAWLLIVTIPVVGRLPEGVDTVAEYVVSVTATRFGVPVAALLLFASLLTGLGHNKGDGRPGLDFASKLCSVGAASFAVWAVATGIGAGVTY